MKKYLLVLLIVGMILGCSKKEEKQDEYIQNKSQDHSNLKSAAETGYTWELFSPEFYDKTTEPSSTTEQTVVTYEPVKPPPPKGHYKITFANLPELKLYAQRIFKMYGGFKYRVTYSSGTNVSCFSSLKTPMGDIHAGESIEWTDGNCTFMIDSVTNTSGSSEALCLTFERLVPGWTNFVPSYITSSTSGTTFYGNNKMSFNTGGGSGQITYIMPVGFEFKVSYENILCSKVAIPNSGIPPQLRQTAGGSFRTPLGNLEPNVVANWTSGNCTFSGGGEAGGYIEIQNLKFQIYKSTIVTQPTEKWEVFNPAITTTIISPSVFFTGNNRINMGVNGGSGQIKYSMTGGRKYRVTISNINCSKIADPGTIPPVLHQNAGGSFRTPNGDVVYNIPNDFVSGDCIFTAGGSANSYVELQNLVFERLK